MLGIPLTSYRTKSTKICIKQPEVSVFDSRSICVCVYLWYYSPLSIGLSLWALHNSGEYLMSSHVYFYPSPCN